jgi:hypothetical protein
MGITFMACTPWARLKVVSSQLRKHLKNRAKVLFLINKIIAYGKNRGFKNDDP